MYYSLVSDDFLAMYQHVLRYALSEIAELEKTLNRQREKSHSRDAISLEELEAMIRHKNVLVLDVRPPAEYALGHITGAVSAPLDELLCCLKDFSKNQEIVAYCRGPFCVLADEAVKMLREKGLNVRRLDEGYPEWKMSRMEADPKN